MTKQRAGQFKNSDRSAAADDSVLRQGMAALERRSDEAERIARDLLGRRPQHAGALLLLGLSLLAQHRARDAVAPLEQVARDSTDPMVETQYALALRHVGRTTEAIEWLERATMRQPPFAAAFRDLGVLLCSMRRYEEAEAALKRGLEAAPTVAELSVELGGVYICRADPANAKVAFARALAHAPGHVRALHGFGTALLLEGEYDRAAERFRQVLARNPYHVRARLDLAHSLLERGQHDEAVAMLRGLVRAAPQHYGKALKLLVSSGRGRFWLRPSVAAGMLQLGDRPDSVNRPTLS